MSQAPKQSSPWLAHSSLPKPLITASFVLEPLEEKHAELDFEALMLCRARLREELQWGDWPPEDFSLELNRTDTRGILLARNLGLATLNSVRDEALADHRCFISNSLRA